LLYVWCSSTQPKANMIWYLDSAHQNSWKALSSSNSYTLTHQKLIYNQLYSSDKMMVQVTKHIFFYVWWSSTQPKQNWFGIWIEHIKIVGKHSLSVIHLLTHMRNANYQPTLQQWQNLGSSNKNTYYSLFEDLPLNQKQKWFDHWIHHIKLLRNHSLSGVYILPNTRNYFQVTLQQWPNHGSCMKNTCYLLFEDVPLKQK